MAPLFMVIACPLIAALVILATGEKFANHLSRVMGVLGILGSLLAALLLWSTSFNASSQRIFLWSVLPISTVSFSGTDISFLIDPLSITMTLVVTFVSFWIVLYATEYMAHDEGQPRFFASVNLFVFFMLLLVLADNLFLLLIGWEGVGVCSYLLIGFYFREKAAGFAALKAFLTTRLGDIFLLFAVILCAVFLGTISLPDINAQAPAVFALSPWVTTAIALCLLGGAVGKSAQIPLQIWLPDAMWGPTPVSALIHAATMVTAGVYLMARMSPLVYLHVEVEAIICAIGAATLLIGGLSALVQTDLKRVLAYSTMSQIGYMFLALGVHAPKAAVFHLTTHAFFKALLFLTAGVIGHTLHTYDMSKMGGLYKTMPLIAWLFFIGCMSLMGIPLISSGFFSKEWILGQALAHHSLGTFAYTLGIIGVFLTGLYTTRMIMLVFFGPAQSKASSHMGLKMSLPLIMLAVFSITIGWLETPPLIAHAQWFSHWLSGVFVDTGNTEPEHVWALLLPSACSFVAIMIGYGWWRSKRLVVQQNVFLDLIKDGLGFNLLYVKVLMKPLVVFASAVRVDVIERLITYLKPVCHVMLAYLGQLHQRNIASLISWFVIAAIAVTSAVVLS